MLLLFREMSSSLVDYEIRNISHMEQEDREHLCGLLSNWMGSANQDALLETEVKDPPLDGFAAGLG